MSMLACQYNQPNRPGDLDLWPFDLESDVRVTCDVGYLCANFSLPIGLSVLQLGPPNVRDRQTGVRQKHRLMPASIIGAVA